MKKEFPGWYQITSQERGALSRYAIFALDSNVLLNLYGMGDSTRTALLEILRRLAFKKRLWLPHQSALEFQRQRPGKILEQIAPAKKLRENIKKVLDVTEKALSELGDHPFIDESMNLPGYSGGCVT